MKKFALSLFAVLSIFACTPEKQPSYDDPGSGKPDAGGNGGIPAGDIVEVTAFSIEGMEGGQSEMSLSIPINAARAELEIQLAPSNANPVRDLRISADRNDKVDFGLNNSGLYIVPKAEGGVTTLSVVPQLGRLSAKKIYVTVTEKPAEPVSVSIAKTGNGFKDGVLQLTEGDSFNVKANVKDDKGNNSPSEPLTWEVVDGGDYITIDKSGKVTAKPISEKTGKTARVKVTVTATASSANPLTDVVDVDIAAIAKINIDRTGTSSSNTFTVTAGGSALALKAKVYNSRDEEVSKDIIWSRTAGDSNVNVDSQGNVKAEAGATGNAQIQAKVSEKASIYDVVLIKVVPLPAEVAFSNFSGTYTIAASVSGTDQYFIKKGNKMSFIVTVSPAEADQSVIVTSNKTVSSNVGVIEVTTTSTSSGTKVQIEAVSSGNASFLIYVKSESRSSVSKSFHLSVDDYVADDIKPGDYVYYNSSTGKFRSVDCGLRQAYSPTSRGYQASDGTRSGEPRPLSSPGSGYDYIGVIASLNLPSSDDFLRLSLLDQCRNNTADIYNLNTFRKSNLPGFENAASVHALVLCKNQSGEMVFQSSTETIAQTDDKNNGIYQYQLKNVVALSKNESDKGYGEYVKYGLLNHLLLNFYNTKLKNYVQYNVRPVAYVASMTNIPKLTPGSGKRSTGWFLPGEGEWSMLSSNLELVSLSLSKSGFGSLNSSVYFWLPCEYDEENAMSGKPNGNSYQYDKNDKQFPARPMLYL